jgi:hypothetical protein
VHKSFGSSNFPKGQETIGMRSITGAIIVLAASICLAASVLGEALAKERREGVGIGMVAALVLGVIGIVVVFVGMVGKRE